jgi:hypothetical protein
MKQFILLLFSLGSLAVVAQGEADKWLMPYEYSGDQFLYDFTLDTNPIYTPIVIPLDTGYWYEQGHSVVSDNDGDLLFFSNGSRVYNNTYNLMSNGILDNGHRSSMEGTIVVKHPGYHNQYHLFYADAIEDSCENGLSYAIIDMCLDSGRGEVVVKDQQFFEYSTECVNAFQHENGEDLWLVSPKRYSNEIWSFLLTENGIVDTVISYGISQFDFFGTTKLSPDQNYFIANVYNITTPFNQDNIQIFQTNRLTGELVLDTSFYVEQMCLNRFEISPSSNILYINSCYWDSNQVWNSELWQYSLDSLNFLSTYLIDHDTGGYANVGGNLQNTPNGKMYIHPFYSGFGTLPGFFLGIIHEPDSFGSACNYSGEFWGGQSGVVVYESLMGWPNFPAWYFAPGFGGNVISPYENPCAIIGCMDSSACTYDPLAEVHDSSMCVFISASISYNGDSLYTTDTLHSLLWSTGDTLSYTQASSNGSYWLSITDTAGCSDTAWITVNWLSIEEQKQAFNIYPNPAQTTLFVNKKGVKNIYNLVGEKLLSSSKKRLNIQALAAGVYLIECEGYYRKFIKN